MGGDFNIHREFRGLAIDRAAQRAGAGIPILVEIPFAQIEKAVAIDGLDKDGPARRAESPDENGQKIVLVRHGPQDNVRRPAAQSARHGLQQGKPCLFVWIAGKDGTEAEIIPIGECVIFAWPPVIQEQPGL
jgi:hypothetical protein